MRSKSKLRRPVLSEGSELIIYELRDRHPDRPCTLDGPALARPGGAVLASMRALVLQMGGVTESEAAVLLRVMEILADLEVQRGTELALAVLGEVRAILLDEPQQHETH